MDGIFGVRGNKEESRAAGWVPGSAFWRQELLSGRQMWNGKRELTVLFWFKLPSSHPSRDSKLVADCVILTKSRGKVWAGDGILRVFTQYKDTTG